MVLTQKQRDELHRSIYEYLKKNKFESAAEAFAAEIGPQALANDYGATKDDLLEKKWTSVVKLKRQVLELQQQVRLFKENPLPGPGGPGGGGGGGASGDSLPR